MIGMQRIIVWELPLLGPDVTFIRVSASLLLPIIAGIKMFSIGLFSTVPILQGKFPKFLSTTKHIELGTKQSSLLVRIFLYGIEIKGFLFCAIKNMTYNTMLKSKLCGTQKSEVREN